MTQQTATPPAASSPIDPHATADAITMIASHRAAVGSQIPFAAWSMLAHAEDRLNKELKEYFHGTREGIIEDPQPAAGDGIAVAEEEIAGDHDRA